MRENEFRPAFEIHIERDGRPLTVMTSEGCMPRNNLPEVVDEIGVRFEETGAITIRMILGGRYQDLTYNGPYSIYWGVKPFILAVRENEAPQIEDERLARLVARAILVQLDRDDTSSKSVAEEVERHFKANIRITERKVGYIAREWLGLATMRAGGNGRYCIVVRPVDRERLQRLAKEASDAPE